MEDEKEIILLLTCAHKRVEKKKEDREREREREREFPLYIFLNVLDKCIFINALHKYYYVNKYILNRNFI